MFGIWIISTKKRLKETAKQERNKWIICKVPPLANGEVELWRFPDASGATVRERAGAKASCWLSQTSPTLFPCHSRWRAGEARCAHTYPRARCRRACRPLRCAAVKGAERQCSVNYCCFVEFFRTAKLTKWPKPNPNFNPETSIVRDVPKNSTSLSNSQSQ